MNEFEEALKRRLERTLKVPVFTGTPIEGLTAEEAERQDRDRFPRAMIEGSTEYDWADLPDWLKDVMRDAADDFWRWADTEPISGQVVSGELANEIEATK